MGEENGDMPDVFGKIDALLGKRVGFMPIPKMKSLEEAFPLLTDVVGRQVSESQPAPGAADAISSDAGITPASVLPTVLDEALERLLQDMFIRQQIRIEESVRNIVREELDKHLGAPE